MQPIDNDDSINLNSPTDEIATTTTALSLLSAPSTTSTPISELVAGTSEVVVNGQVVESKQVQRGNAVTVKGGNVVARVSGLETSTSDSENSEVVLTSGKSVQLSLQGLQPDSEAMVVIYSEPRQLGVLKVDSLGGFLASIKIPSDLEPGSHTLVISGLDKDGSSIKLKFGLVLYPNKATLVSLWIWPTVILLTLALFGSVTWTRKVKRENSEYWQGRMRDGIV